VKRLGVARLARFLYRHSRGTWGQGKAAELLEAADETIALWSGELDFSELADDIAVEARLALEFTEEIKELDERITVLYAKADPDGIFVSAPGVGTIIGAQLLGRLGDPNRFRSLAGVRSFSGLVPSLDASGTVGQHGGPTKRGDACLREAIFMAADHARRADPTLAARYHRLMVSAGKHHNSALCHVATTLLTRIVTCWRKGERYVIRDLDGRPISAAEGRKIVSERYPIPDELRRSRRSVDKEPNARWRTSRRSQESQSAPSTGPSKGEATPVAMA
jgi:transposase